MCRIERYLFVNLSQPSYEYDVNSIVKAFYPDRQVKVLTTESKVLWEEYREVKADPEKAKACEEIQVEFSLFIQVIEEGRKVCCPFCNHSRLGII